MVVEQRPVGKAGQVIVMREVVDVIGAAAVFGDIAAGDSDSVAEPDNLDVQPGGLNHLIVDEDFAGVGNSGANDLAVLVDEAGFGHERPDFSEDFAVEGFAGHAEAALRVGVDVAEGEVDDVSGRIEDAVEDVEVVKRAFSSGQKSRGVR